MVVGKTKISFLGVGINFGRVLKFLLVIFCIWNFILRFLIVLVLLFFEKIVFYVLELYWIFSMEEYWIACQPTK